MSVASGCAGIIAPETTSDHQRNPTTNRRTFENLAARQALVGASLDDVAQLESRCNMVELSPDGSQVFSATRREYGVEMTRWDVESGKLLQSYSQSPRSGFSWRGMEPVGLALTNDGDWLAVVTEHPVLHLWHVVTGRYLIHELGGSGVYDRHFDVKERADGRCLVIASWKATVVFDRSQGRVVRALPGGALIDEDRMLAVTGTRAAGRAEPSSQYQLRGEWRLLDISTGDSSLLGRDLPVPVFAGVISAGKQLAVAEKDGTVVFLDLATKELLATWHQLQQGFLWTTPPDEAAPNGWIWTDREDRIQVARSGPPGSPPTPLELDHPDRLSYLAIYNNQKMVMSRLRDRGAHRALLAEFMSHPAARARDRDKDRRLLPERSVR